MPPESYFAFMFAIFLFSLKPGPCISMLMVRSVSEGMSGFLTTLLGVNIGLAIYLAIVFIGLETLSVDIVFLTIVVKSLAAVYLIYIGIKELQSDTPKLSIEQAEANGFVNNLSSAIVLTLSNPMVIVFYASIIPAFITAEALTLDWAFLIAGTIMVIDSIGMSVYCIPLLLYRKKIPHSFMNKIRVISSVIIILIGLYIGYTAIGASDILSVF